MPSGEGGAAAFWSLIETFWCLEKTCCLCSRLTDRPTYIWFFIFGLVSSWACFRELEELPFPPQEGWVPSRTSLKLWICIRGGYRPSSRQKIYPAWKKIPFPPSKISRLYSCRKQLPAHLWISLCISPRISLYFSFELLYSTNFSMNFSVNLSLHFLMNFSMNFSERNWREESWRREKTGGKFLAGFYIWWERDLFLGGIIFLGGKMDRPLPG